MYEEKPNKRVVCESCQNGRWATDVTEWILFHDERPNTGVVKNVKILTSYCCISLNTGHTQM